MNMSGPYSGYFSGQPFVPNQRQQYFAEYSLWGNSSFRLDPVELLHPINHHPVGFPNQISPHQPHPPDLRLQGQYEQQMPPNATPEAPGDPEEPEMTGKEEPEKNIIHKEALYKNFENFLDNDNSNMEPEADVASNSSGSSSGAEWTQHHFQRSGHFHPAYPWNSRATRIVHNRGRKAYMMQRRLVRALSQPVKMDKGASMMQRMGWMGGGLGRHESGITDPVAPNAIYATTTMGFGQEAQFELTRRPNLPYVNKQQTKSTMKQNFTSNTLRHLLSFVKDDLQAELYFDVNLKSSERKRIHRIVGALVGIEEANGELDNITEKQSEMVKDIRNRIFYQLATESEGERNNRQICVYKEAPSHMFLITPDDCRPALTEIKEVEEDVNPFLKSITKHIKPDEGSITEPKPPHLFDKLINYFIDFSTDVYTELRFLGPFTNKEIYVINNFFSLIDDLSKKSRPYFKVPLELLDVFVADYVYTVHTDVNGFTSIKRTISDIKSKDTKPK